MRAIRDHYRFVPVGPHLPPRADNDTARISHDDLKAGHCRWIAGDPMHGGEIYCGEVRQRGLPYCHGHSRRAYRVISAAPVQVFFGD